MNNHIKGNIRKLNEEIDARCHVLRALLDMFKGKQIGKVSKNLAEKKMEEQIDTIEGLRWILAELKKE